MIPNERIKLTTMMFLWLDDVFVYSGWKARWYSTVLGLVDSLVWVYWSQTLQFLCLAVHVNYHFFSRSFSFLFPYLLVQYFLTFSPALETSISRQIKKRRENETKRRIHELPWCFCSGWTAGRYSTGAGG